ncbi:MAG: hypothetical protein ABIS14_14760 [Sphingomonas sp.]
MRVALFQPGPGRQRVPLRERVTASGLAIAIELLIALALLYALTPLRQTIKTQSEPKSFTLSDTSDKQAATRSVARHAAKQKRAAAAAPAPSRAPVPTRTPVKSAPKSFQLAGLLPIDLDKADISKIHSGEAATADAGNGAGKDSGTSYGPGDGPGGERLFNVAWYREPTNAELAGYLPNGAPPNSWAEIACKMIADYHVENCRPLGESPAGSGLARSMRQAAWQFLVRPPRVGDKVMLGTWVRIRIDFSAKAGG